MNSKSATELKIMNVKNISEPRGIIKNPNWDKNIHLTRYPPAKELEFLIEHFWTVSWDLENKEEHVQDVLSHPNIHISIENQVANIYGIVPKIFKKTLTKKGFVFSIKFRPASFAYLTNASLSEFTNRVLPLSPYLNPDFIKIFEDPFKENISSKIETISNYLLELKLKQDPIIVKLNDLVYRIQTNIEIKEVSELVHLSKISLRNLQRMFKKYIGISPQWIIMRYRLHEALSQMEKDADNTSLTRLAYDLNYFDQTHFIKDFKKFTGLTPGEYKKKMNL